MAKVSEALTQRLKQAGLSTRRFLKLKAQGKEAIEKDWPDRLYEPEELEGWSGNVGITASDGLVLLDADDEPLANWLRQNLPETFTVLSPGHGKPHYYLKAVGDGAENLVLYWGEDEKGNRKIVGHVQVHHKYLVAPGSTHPNGQPYRILDDKPIAEIEWSRLVEILKPFLKERIERVEETAERTRRESGLDINILRVVPLAGLKRRGDEYQGPHPVHGSTTGKPPRECTNFCVNVRKNVWKCFAHDSGGGPLEYLAVEEGLIRCEDAGPGALRGEIFKKVLEAAVKRGLISEDAVKPKATVAIATPPTTPASEISETFTFTGDRLFKGRVQVGALTTPLSRFMRLRFKCKNPGECKVADCPLHKGLILSVNDAKRFDPSAFATYFDTNNPIDALSVYAEKRAFSRCAEWRKKVIYRGRDERAVTGALVYDLTGREGRAWFIHGEHCDLRRAPNWVIADGWLCRGYKGRIGVLIQAFVSESEVMAPPPEEVERARGALKALTVDKGLEGSNVWHIAELLRRKVNAKGEEVRKGFAADLLNIASPVWVETPESGDKELGATTSELGPSTNYKSQRARFMVGWLGAGKYLRGRKTEAGLTAGLEKVEGLGWVAKKGALPSADLSFIIVDNADPHALDEQIESRRDGIVSMAGIKSMEIWARTRLKLLNNPQQSFDELVYKCTALKMFDSKLVARFTFAFYTYGVNVDERYDPEVSSLSAEEEAVLEAVRTVLRWNLSRETTYTVPLSIWPRVMAYARGLERTFGCEDIPLLLRNIPYKLAVLAYSFALLEGEVEPQIRHYRLAMQWLNYCARDIELDKYAETQKALRNLSSEEYEKIEKALTKDIEEDVKAKGGCTTDSYLFKIVDYLVKHGKSRRDELAAYLEVDEKTVTRKVNVLKGLGLLRSDKDGYSFTAKGVMFVKRWLEHVPEVPDVSASGGQAPSEGAPKTSLSPESGDMEGIGDMEKRRCEVCGGKATTRIVREDGVHWLCGKCLADWEGNL